MFEKFGQKLFLIVKDKEINLFERIFAKYIFLKIYKY